MTDSAHLTAFAARYDFPLDDYQLEACRRLDAGAGVLVAAPTGAGKTVVGEYAVFLARQAGQKCFYTTPIKALSNQKYHDLVEVYGSDQVGLLTGDQSLNSEAPVVVMTTEVLRNMIYAGSSTLAGLGYVVMDEVHYLADRFRGPVWEEVILGLAPAVKLVALSATVSNVEEFGDWLVEVRGPLATVVSERRPVPLFQHVFAGHQLYDLYAGLAPTAQTEAGGDLNANVNPELTKLARQESRQVRDDSRRPRGRSGKGKRSTFGSGQFGGAAHGRFASRSYLVPKRSAVLFALDRQQLLPAIYFIFSRQGCDQAVRRLVADEVVLTRPAEQRQLHQIAQQAITSLEDDDLEALGFGDWLDGFCRGIAAHHAGLLPQFKQAVEEAFSLGLVKVVFATETLALGINMPAKTVVLDSLVKYNGESHADITAGEYTQLTGRAGRRGIDVEGHAVVTWQAGLDPRALASLASRRTYPLYSAFNPSANMAVNLIGSLGTDKAHQVLEDSFAQFHADRSRGGGRGQRSRQLVDKFDRVCGVLEALGYLETVDDALVVTPWGRRLSRIYGEQDLVVAEAIRATTFDSLTPPQLAAVLSCLVYEARRPGRTPPARLPDRATDRALAELRRLSREVALLERDFRLEPRPDLSSGFAAVAYHWADGAYLSEVLDHGEITPGDFVRWMRQVIDLAGQIADATAGTQLSTHCRRLARSLSRGVVEAVDDSDAPG